MHAFNLTTHHSPVERPDLMIAGLMQKRLNMMQNKELLTDIRKGDRKRSNRFELLYEIHGRNLSKLECKGIINAVIVE